MEQLLRLESSNTVPYSIFIVSTAAFNIAYETACWTYCIDAAE